MKRSLTPYVLLGIVSALIIALVLSPKATTSVTAAPVSASIGSSNINQVTELKVNAVPVTATLGAVVTNKKSIKQLFLSSENTIFLTGVVDANAPYIGQQINHMAQNGKPIYLVINSPGGSVLDGAAIINAIQASPVPVNTICLQLCASMAALIHQYGNQRYMADRSLLMFHEAAGGFQGYFNHMKSRLAVLDRYTQKMDYDVAIRTKQDPAAFSSKLANEIWVDGEDALKQNYADGLVNVNLVLPQDQVMSEKLKLSLSQTNMMKNHFYIYAE